jgi:hypothetical protein
VTQRDAPIHVSDVVTSRNESKRYNIDECEGASSAERMKERTRASCVSSASYILAKLTRFASSFTFANGIANCDDEVAGESFDRG